VIYFEEKIKQVLYKKRYITVKPNIYQNPQSHEKYYGISSFPIEILKNRTVFAFPDRRKTFPAAKSYKGLLLGK